MKRGNRRDRLQKICPGRGRRRRVLLSAAAVAAALAASPSVRADTLLFAPIADSTIYQLSPDGNNGAFEEIFVGDANGISHAGTRRTVIRFDLSSIPVGSTVMDATLTLRLRRVGSDAGGDILQVHRLDADWGEGSSNAMMGNPTSDAQAGEVTWDNRFHPSTPWSTAGGGVVGGASASAVVGTVGTDMVWSSAQLVADVQGWVASPATNFGWRIRGQELNVPGTGDASAVSFHARNGTVVPELEVVFMPEPGAALGAAVALGAVASLRRLRGAS